MAGGQAQKARGTAREGRRGDEVQRCRQRSGESARGRTDGGRDGEGCGKGEERAPHRGMSERAHPPTPPSLFPDMCNPQLCLQGVAVAGPACHSHLVRHGTHHHDHRRAHGTCHLCISSWCGPGTPETVDGG